MKDPTPPRPPFVFVVCFDGGPVTAFADDEQARDFLADVFLDDVKLYQIWSGDEPGSMLEDRTVKFAEEWSKCIDFGDGDDPFEFLRTFPPFVLAYQRDQLIAAYRAAQAVA